jgi:hypothetical protein
VCAGTRQYLRSCDQSIVGVNNISFSVNGETYPDLFAAIDGKRISAPHKSGVDVGEPDVLNDDVATAGNSQAFSFAEETGCVSWSNQFEGVELNLHPTCSSLSQQRLVRPNFDSRQARLFPRSSILM